jgi:hypothetical protein
MIAGLLSVLGLGTATGLNAYLPLLVIGLLARYTDLVALNPPYDLLSNPVVLTALAVLAVLDFAADKVPVVDHALHVAGLVIHPVLGALVCLAATSSAGSVHPVVAAVCGLVLAGGTHGARAAARPVATVGTVGLANPAVSFAEDVLSLVLTALAVLVPTLALLLVVLIILWTVRRLWRWVAPRPQAPDTPR